MLMQFTMIIAIFLFIKNIAQIKRHTVLKKN